MSTRKELSREEAVRVFEKSWKELIEEYADTRTLSAFCSEADVELHLAHKLLKSLPPESVHIEFPMPLEVERLSGALWYWGRVGMRKCIKPDVVVIDTLLSEPYLMAELKFAPIYQSYLPLFLAIEKKLGKEDIEELKKGLKRSLSYLERLRQEEPTQQDIEKNYFGVDKNGRTNVGKLIQILNDFERKEKTTVAGYLCVIDELYPDIKKILQEAIEKYNPPSQFKVLAKHFPFYENLQDALEKL